MSAAANTRDPWHWLGLATDDHMNHLQILVTHADAVKVRCQASKSEASHKIQFGTVVHKSAIYGIASVEVQKHGNQ